MTRKQIQQKARELVVDELGFPVAPADRVSDTVTFAELGADSLDGIEICMAVEKEFDLEIGDDEWEPVKSVNGIVDLVSAKLGVKE